VSVIELRLCIDVPDLDRAIAFYVEALGLRPGRRNGALWAELLGGPCPIDLLPVEAGSPASPDPELQEGAAPRRSFARHWTPIHLDVVVPDVDAAARRAVAAGARLERPVVSRRWGRMANLADPFGHGLCLLQFEGRGYDEIVGG
jgi:catechol 2,3-dioxygenase-like lactoylglutathione lyase family enzyme